MGLGPHTGVHKTGKPALANQEYVIHTQKTSNSNAVNSLMLLRECCNELTFKSLSHTARNSKQGVTKHNDRKHEVTHAAGDVINHRKLKTSPK